MSWDKVSPVLPPSPSASLRGLVMGVLVNYALMLSVGFADLVSKVVCFLE